MQSSNKKHLKNDIKITIKDIEKALREIEESELKRQKENEAIFTEIKKGGIEVFGDIGLFDAWLKKPSGALAGKTPLEVMISGFWVEMVLGVLNKKKDGIIPR